MKKARFFVCPTPSFSTAEEPYYKKQFIGEGVSPSVHSPTVVELSTGALLAVWYGGNREGSQDVLLYRSVFDQKKGQWGKVTPLTGPKETQSDLNRYIRKIGNPSLLRDRSGKIWLFYVTVSIGGWSGGSISYRTSLDDGAHFSPAKRLVTSPFFNISTLVRTAPFLYEDGTIGLPVYHELIGKFGELLWIDANGRVKDKRRISWGRSSLQPSIVPVDATRGIAFFRSARERQILESYTEDGGRHWSRVEKMGLPNPDSSVMGLQLHDKTILLVFNNSDTNREYLSLARSADQGKTWTVIHHFESVPSEGKNEFSYPFLIQGGDGTIHLLYTWNRKQICHIAFNTAFLESL
jgi:predicted neuraminidase